MTPAFSIILPVYNVAQYLRACLDSVLAQTFGNWEIICVDDGSTDGSGTILDEYAARDSRFRVLHQPNAGVSAARNRALEVAVGQWLTFLDGDDMLREDALEMFASYIQCRTQLDGILVQPYIPYWDGGTIPPRTMADHVLLECATKEDLFLGPYAANGFCISRVYRRSKFGHLRFRTDLAMREDVCFWFDALCVDAKWMILNAEYYLYRQRADSACGSRNPHHCVQVLESMLHALHDLDTFMDPAGNAKIAYLRRFPLPPVEHLNLALRHRREISDGEWNAIAGKLEAIESLAGERVFPRHLKAKVMMATRRKWRPLLSCLMACESIVRFARKCVGKSLRLMGLRKRK